MEWLSTSRGGFSTAPALFCHGSTEYTESTEKNSFREFRVSVTKKELDSSDPYASSKRVWPGFAISNTPDHLLESRSQNRLIASHVASSFLQVPQLNSLLREAHISFYVL